jgi:hypothetical protein
MLVELAQVVSHLLHFAAVVIDAQNALHKELELSVEVERTSLTIVEELLLEGNRELLSSDVVGADGLLEVDGDGAEQPRQDHTIHLAPVGVVEGRSDGGNVVVEGVALERQQHEVTPTWVLGAHDAQDEGH